MTTRKLRVAMHEILDAMEGSDRNMGIQHFLDLKTGAVVTVFPDDLGEPDANGALIDEHPGRFKAIPQIDTREQFNWMSAFLAIVDESDLREKLAIALNGRGAFGRFRDVLNRYRDWNDRFHAFRQEQLIAEALGWFESLGIAPDYTLAPISRPVDPPAPAKPPPPRVGLVDLLLLGAPDGKTEVVDSRVRRQWTARDAGHARSAFKQLARDVCEHCGEPWRKRFVENTSKFAMQQFHLSVEGSTVVLEIEVARDVVNLFVE